MCSTQKKAGIVTKIRHAKRPLLCVPLVEYRYHNIQKSLDKILEKQPDIIEWRVDYLTNIALNALVEAAISFRQKLGKISLLLTCRSWEEGGHSRQWTLKKRFQLIETMVCADLVDGIDTELHNDTWYRNKIVSFCRKHDVASVLSYHNFTETPPVETILRIFSAIEMAEADIAKVAVMPRCHKDVLTLLSATEKAKSAGITIPIITVSMDKMGVTSRFSGGLFGSVVSFATVSDCSAPGQLSIDEMRYIMSLLY